MKLKGGKEGRGIQEFETRRERERERERWSKDVVLSRSCDRGMLNVYKYLFLYLFFSISFNEFLN